MTIEEAEALAGMSGAAPEGSDRKSQGYGGGASNITACRESSWAEVEMRLMEEVVSRGNMMAAYERVLRNKGAPGVDGMQVGELRTYLQEQWPRIREELLNGTCQPKAVRKVEIPKPAGMWPKGGGGWSISTWRSSSTEWDTMCSWPAWPARSKTVGCCSSLAAT